MDVATQISVFLAVNHGLFDKLTDAQILTAQQIIHKTLHQRFKSVIEKITLKRQKLDTDIQENLLSTFKKAMEEKGL